MPLFHPATPAIAMLHAVSEAAHPALADWSISPKTFLRLLDAVQEAGLATTHFAEAAEAEKVSGDFARQVILSFDDCYKHLFDFAVPELMKRNMKAVFYMPTAYVGGSNEWDRDKGAPRLELMNAQDLRQLVDLGMEVGSHGHRHVNLKTVSPGQVKEEVVVSKALLEEITGRPVRSFAYPYGAVPSGYKNLLAGAGYSHGVSIYQRVEDSLALRRFGVYEKDGRTALNRKLSRRYRWMRTVYDAVKRF